MTNKFTKSRCGVRHSLWAAFARLARQASCSTAEQEVAGRRWKGTHVGMPKDAIHEYSGVIFSFAVFQQGQNDENHGRNEHLNEGRTRAEDLEPGIFIRALNVAITNRHGMLRREWSLSSLCSLSRQIRCPSPSAGGNTRYKVTSKPAHVSIL